MSVGTGPINDGRSVVARAKRAAEPAADFTWCRSANPAVFVGSSTFFRRSFDTRCQTPTAAAITIEKIIVVTIQ